MGLKHEYEEGQKVNVPRHKCGPTDIIGPFIGEFVYMEDDNVALIADPAGRDWGIDINKISPVDEK